MTRQQKTFSPTDGHKAHEKRATKRASEPGSRKPLSRQARSRFSDEYAVLLSQLIAARKAVGVTQVEIAARLGKTQSHVSMCENREREISIIDLWRWCSALDIKVSDFLREFEEAIAGSSTSNKR